MTKIYIVIEYNPWSSDSSYYTGFYKTLKKATERKEQILEEKKEEDSYRIKIEEYEIGDCFSEIK